jgi:microcystin-dependent protein
MAQPYVGEIRIFAGNFAPQGWMFCEGQTIPIADYDTLFALIGTTYGGDGQSTFALPDLRGRLPVHQGNGFGMAATGGVEQVTLTTAQMPAHSHAMVAIGDRPGDQTGPGGNLPAESFNVTPYINDAPTGSFHPAAVGPAGGSQPHPNLQPYLCVNHIISMFGIFPSQT